MSGSDRPAPDNPSSARRGGWGPARIIRRGTLRDATWADHLGMYALAVAAGAAMGLYHFFRASGDSVFFPVRDDGGAFDLRTLAVFMVGWTLLSCAVMTVWLVRDRRTLQRHAEEEEQAREKRRRLDEARTAMRRDAM